MLFIGQNLKHIHMTYSFIELLIFFWLTLDILVFAVYFWPQQINIIYEYKLCGKPVMKQKQTFAIDVEKTFFLM